MKLDNNLSAINLEYTSSEHALTDIATRMFEQGYVKFSYIRAVLDREENFPTGILFDGYGVAIPHTDSCHVNKEIISINILKNPVIFKSIEDGKTDISINIIIMLAVYKNDNQLKVLSQLIDILQNKNFVENIRKTKDKITLTKLFEREINKEC